MLLYTILSCQFIRHLHDLNYSYHKCTKLTMFSVKFHSCHWKLFYCLTKGKNGYLQIPLIDFFLELSTTSHSLPQWGANLISEEDHEL